MNVFFLCPTSFSSYWYLYSILKHYLFTPNNVFIPDLRAVSFIAYQNADFICTPVAGRVKVSKYKAKLIRQCDLEFTRQSDQYQIKDRQITYSSSTKTTVGKGRK